jgi:hypothetical protein
MSDYFCVVHLNKTESGGVYLERHKKYKSVKKILLLKNTPKIILRQNNTSKNK